MQGFGFKHDVLTQVFSCGVIDEGANRESILRISRVVDGRVLTNVKYAVKYNIGLVQPLGFSVPFGFKSFYSL